MGRAQKLKKQRARESQKSREGANQPRHPLPPRGAGKVWSFSTLLALGVLVVVGAAVYANSFSIPFLFDDYFVIVSNPEIRSFEPLSRFLSQSRGIPHFLDTLNYSWSGEQVWGYHLINVCIHLLNAMLAYLLALSTFRLPVHSGRYGKHAGMLALIVALIFVVHPLNTMAVSYIVQRAESVAASFYLLALVLFVGAGGGWLRISTLPLSILLLLIGFLGIVSKETVASLPAALLLYHVCFLRDGAKQDNPAGWKLALPLALPVLYGIYLARHFLLPGFGSEVEQSAWLYIPSAGLGVDGITPWRYLTTQFGVLLWYLRLYFLPTRLCFDYGWPFAESFWSFGVLAPLATWLGLIAAAALLYRRNRWPAFGIGWCVVTLAPSSSIIPIKDAAFEYRMYLPIVGLTTMLVALAFDALSSEAWGRSRQVYDRVAIAIAVAIVIGLGVLTVNRNRTLQDEFLLAQDSAEKAPWHWRNHYALGSALLEKGRREEAVGPFAKAVELGPEHHTSRIMLGDLYSRLGRMEEAEDVLLPALDAREESVSAAAFRQLGFLYKAQSYPYAAVGMFEEALERKSKWQSLELQIVRLLRHAGDWHDAAFRLNNLVHEVPSYQARLGAEIAQINLLGGVQSYEAGEPEFARNMLEIAMQHGSTLRLAGHMLAFVEWRSGKKDRSLELLEDLQRRGVADPALIANLERARSDQDLLPPTSTAALRSASFS